MKSLDQVEPRIPISSLPITISQPGSYYATGNLLGAAGQHGITINGPQVSIDLMGFELRGVPGSLSGIQMNPAASPHIRNGSIVHWGRTAPMAAEGSSKICACSTMGVMASRLTAAVMCASALPGPTERAS